MLATFRQLLKFSLLIYLTYVINFLYLRVDYLLIERKSGLAELGIYSVASGVAQFLTVIPMSINSIMLPHLSGLAGARAIKAFRLFASLNALCLVVWPVYFGRAPDRS